MDSMTAAIHAREPETARRYLALASQSSPVHEDSMKEFSDAVIRFNWAKVLAIEGEFAEAELLIGELIDLFQSMQPKFGKTATVYGGLAYQTRSGSHFMRGHINDGLADLKRAAELLDRAGDVELQLRVLLSRIEHARRFGMVDGDAAISELDTLSEKVSAASNGLQADYWRVRSEVVEWPSPQRVVYLLKALELLGWAERE